MAQVQQVGDFAHQVSFVLFQLTVGVSDAPKLLDESDLPIVIELRVEDARELVHGRRIVGIRVSRREQFVDFGVREMEYIAQRFRDQRLLAIVDMMVRAAHFDHQRRRRALQRMLIIVVADRTREGTGEDGFQLTEHASSVADSCPNAQGEGSLRGALPDRGFWVEREPGESEVHTASGRF